MAKKTDLPTQADPAAELVTLRAQKAALEAKEAVASSEYSRLSAAAGQEILSGADPDTTAAASFAARRDALRSAIATLDARIAAATEAVRVGELTKQYVKASEVFAADQRARIAHTLARVMSDHLLLRIYEDHKRTLQPLAEVEAAVHSLGAEVGLVLNWQTQPLTLNGPDIAEECELLVGPLLERIHGEIRALADKCEVHGAMPIPLSAWVEAPAQSVPPSVLGKVKTW